MKINELVAYLERELQYPIGREQVIDAIGQERLDAPGDGGSASIERSLARLNEQTYDSAEELFNAIVGTLEDAYIGRKYYDDRGPNPATPSDADPFPDQESF